MKNAGLFSIYFIIALIKFNALYAAYSPSMIASMVSPNSTIVCSVSNGVCSTDVATTKRNQWDTAYNYTEKWYNSSGRIYQQPKGWKEVVSITDATAQSVDISSAGFTVVNSYKITVNDNIPTQVLVNSVSTTAVVLDSYQLLSTGVTILGIPVIQTTVMGAATNLTGLQVSVEVNGY